MAGLIPMTNCQMNDIDRFMQEKLQAYKDFLKATMLLKEALRNEDMVKVDQLLEERENLARQVDRLDQQGMRYGQVMNLDPNWVYRSRPTKTASEIEEIIESIVTANRDCETLAASRCADLKNDLITVRQKEAGMHGYIAKPQRLPVYLSVKT